MDKHWDYYTATLHERLFGQHVVVRGYTEFDAICNLNDEVNRLGIGVNSIEYAYLHGCEDKLLGENKVIADLKPRIISGRIVFNKVVK